MLTQGRDRPLQDHLGLLELHTGPELGRTGRVDRAGRIAQPAAGVDRSSGHCSLAVAAHRNAAVEEGRESESGFGRSLGCNPHAVERHSLAVGAHTAIATEDTDYAAADHIGLALDYTDRAAAGRTQVAEAGSHCSLDLAGHTAVAAGAGCGTRPRRSNRSCSC